MQTAKKVIKKQPVFLFKVRFLSWNFDLVTKNRSGAGRKIIS